VADSPSNAWLAKDRELHLALATPTDVPAFASEALTDADLNAQLVDIRQHASTILNMLQERLSYLPDEVVEVAASVLGRRRQILDRFVPLNGDFPTQRIRIHGDYHLGQVAYAGLKNYARHPEYLTRLEPWAQLWERSAAAEFLRAYYQTAQGAAFMSPGNIDFRKLLDIFLQIRETLIKLSAFHNRSS